MIVTEQYEDRPDLVRTYSNTGMVIEQVGSGIRYEEAVDGIDSGRTYIETDEPIVKPEDGSEEAYAEVGRILLGEREVEDPGEEEE